MLVEDIMTRKVISVSPGDAVIDALRLTRENRIRHLPVITRGDHEPAPGAGHKPVAPGPERPGADGEEQGRLVGIVSDRDLRDACPSILCPGDDDLLRRTPVGKIMHTRVVTAHPLDPIEEAARRLYEHRIGCLPVVRGEGLIGIVTETDLLRCLVELTGVLKPSTSLEVEVPDRPGMLADVAGIVKRYGINIISVLTTPGRSPDTKTLTLRVATIDPRRLARDIEDAGHRVYLPLNLAETNRP